MKEVLMYRCEGCGLEFKTEESCLEHEEKCWKNRKEVKMFKCSISLNETFDAICFYHKIFVYPKAIVFDNGESSLFDDCHTLVKLNNFIELFYENTITYVFYTDSSASKEDEDKIFNKMHEIIFSKIEEKYTSIKNTLNSKDFLKFSTLNPNGKIEKLQKTFR